MQLNELQWNPRYLAYCRAHGSTPEQMLIADRQAYPGGRMCGFILWSMTKWSEFRKLPGNSSMHAKSPEYDVWLAHQEEVNNGIPHID